MPGSHDGHAADRHAVPPRSFRPEPGEYSTAVELLGPRGRGVGDYLRACLLRLAADPDAALRELAPYWPAARPKGNPLHRAGDGGARPGDAAPGGH